MTALVALLALGAFSAIAYGREPETATPGAVRIPAIPLAPAPQELPHQTGDGDVGVDQARQPQPGSRSGLRSCGAWPSALARMRDHESSLASRRERRRGPRTPSSCSSVGRTAGGLG